MNVGRSQVHAASSSRSKLFRLDSNETVDEPRLNEHWLYGSSQNAISQVVKKFMTAAELEND